MMGSDKMPQEFDLDTQFTKALEACVEIIKAGGVFIYPTDTVYGIGCDATNERAVERVIKIKGRARSKPMSVLMSGLGMIDEYCDVSDEEKVWLLSHLPGPYTILLRLKSEKRSFFSWLHAEKLGVRVPDYVFVRKVSELANKPIITTSANLSGQPSATHDKALDRSVVENVDVVVRAGTTKYKKPSTIVDLESKMHVEREL